MDELKPCPFCGGNVTVWQSEGFGIVRVIECRECQVRFVFPWNQAETGHDLTQKWNRRAELAKPPAPVRMEVKRHV